MPAPTLNRLRRLWFNIHLWIGVGLFVFLVPLGLSGTALVWRPEIERLLHPQRYAVSASTTMLAPSSYLAAAGRAFGGAAAPTRVTYPAAPGAPVVVSGMNPDQPGRRGFVDAWLDPSTGKALSVGSPMGGFSGLMHDLHGQMLVGGGFGRPFVGWLGVFMLVNCLTGIWLWWPRGKFARGFKWSRTRFLGMNLHHMVGFWLAIPLAVLSATGIWIAFPQVGRALSPPPAERAQGRAERGPGGEGRERFRFAPPLAHPHLSADQAVTAAEAQAPGARLVSLALPTEGRDPAWQVGLLSAGAERPATVRVSDATGEILEGRGGPGAFGPPGEGGRDPVMRAMREIHEGEGGLWWKLIASLTGFAPAILGVTGLIRWLTTRRRRPLEAPKAVPG